MINHLCELQIYAMCCVTLITKRLTREERLSDRIGAEGNESSEVAYCKQSRVFNHNYCFDCMWIYILAALEFPSRYLVGRSVAVPHVSYRWFEQVFRQETIWCILSWSWVIPYYGVRHKYGCALGDGIMARCAENRP